MNPNPVLLDNLNVVTMILFLTMLCYAFFSLFAGKKIHLVQ